ncbi:MAG: tetratricopeptide repeat protein [Gemmatimonadales bacterium]
MNLEKLKDTARKLEQKEDWRKAIEVYLKAIQQAESGAETTPDLSLYNRVGDLYLKINDTAEAVRSYERAVDLYADQGFFNNAIALCGKILRVNPGRTQTYLKLSQLHARKNVVIESKRNLIEFLERMNALGQLDQAFQAVKLFADQFSGSQEIRSMLVELLRATSREDEAREQLEKMAEDLEAMGDKAGARKARERLSSAAPEAPEHAPPVTPASAPAPSGPRRGDLIFLDTGVDLGAPPKHPAAHARPKDSPRPPEPPRPVREAPPPSVAEPAVPEGLINNESLAADGMDDLIIDPLVTESSVDAVDPDTIAGLERIGDPLLESDLDLDSPLEIQRQEPPDLDYGGIQLDAVQGGAYEYSPDLAGPLDLPDDFGAAPEADIVMDMPGEPEPALDSMVDMDPPDVTAGLPLIESEEQTAPTLADLEERVLDDPENPDVHLDMAEGLLAAGEDSRVAEELELALAGFEDREDWARAAEMADRLVELTPDSVSYHQKRVELAYRAGDRGPLLEAYLGLGDALAKSGALDKAIAVYGRVIEHDPNHVRAAAALERLGASPEVKREAPAPPKAAPPPQPQSPTAASKPAPKPSPPPPKPAPPAPSPRRPVVEASGDFVDLGSMVFEEEKQRDTRMRVNRREPQDQDEQREFHEILEQFKRGIEQNLDSEDYEAHYDLGVAFKEMGLLDEAIGEFQKALRSPDGRLRTSEALGMAFFEKGQFAACESVLKRALEGVSGSDEAKIGLLYWMGRASEALGKAAEAMATYERAMVVDIGFMDLSKRVQKLSAGRRQ